MRFFSSGGCEFLTEQLKLFELRSFKCIVMAVASSSGLGHFVFGIVARISQPRNIEIVVSARAI